MTATDQHSLIESYVACPACYASVKMHGTEQLKCVSCGAEYPVVDGSIVSMIPGTADEGDFTRAKWDAYYDDDQFQREAERIYREETLPLIVPQIFEYAEERSDRRRSYLEIGCGRGDLGQEMARRGWLFIGVDFSLPVLVSLKRRLEEQGIDNFLLIHGDLNRLPVRDNVIDYSYGGGVIEHFKNPQTVVDHLYRVSVPGGVAFNSVPCFNLGNLVYRSLWGSIPNIPVLKQIAEIVNIRLLGGRHMRFGYELQFTAGQLRRIHTNAGYLPANINVDRFDYTVTLEIIKMQWLRRFVIHLVKTNRQFWQMVKVIGIKQ